MIRRAYIIGTVALGLAVGAVVSAPDLNGFVSSARSARHHFHDLENSGNSLTPIERFVFSLVLAKTAAPETPKQSAASGNRS